MSIFGIISDLFWVMLFFLPPTAITVWLTVSIVRFVSVPKENTELRKKRRTPLIISSVIFSVMAATIIAFMILLTLAIKHM